VSANKGMRAQRLIVALSVFSFGKTLLRQTSVFACVPALFIPTNGFEAYNPVAAGKKAKISLLLS